MRTWIPDIATTLPADAPWLRWRPRWNAGRKSRGPFLQALRTHIGRMQQYMMGATPEERPQRTIALFTGMAGTLTVARAFTDERDRRAILDGARKFYLAAVKA
jgi:hypothetical protein